MLQYSKWVFLPTALVFSAWGGVVSAQSTGVVRFLVDGQPSDTRVLSFEEYVRNTQKIEVKLAGRYEKINVYEATTTLLDSTKPSCVLTPLAPGDRIVFDREGSACSEVFHAFWKGENLTLLLGVPGSASVATLGYQEPQQKPIIEIQKERPCDTATYTLGNAPPVTEADLIFPAAQIPGDNPPDLGGAGKNCALFVANTLSWGICKQGEKLDFPPDAMKALIDEVESTISASAPKPLLYVWGPINRLPTWTKFQIKKNVTDSPNCNPPTSLPPAFDLNAACEKAKLSVNTGYRVCVDARVMGPKNLLVLDCSKSSDGKCVGSTNMGAELPPNQPIRVLIWSEGEKIAGVGAQMDGDLGYSSGIYDPRVPRASEKGSKPEPPAPTSEISLPPAKPGKHKLTVTVNLKPEKVANGGATMTTPDPIVIERILLVRAEYGSALRFGLGFMYTPFAKDVDIATAPNGQRYVAVVGSGQAGPTPELVAGYTWFWDTVKEGQSDLNAGFGFRLGLLSFDGAGGVDTFSSLSLGFEVGTGLDFSMGLYGGVRLIEVPMKGYEPGTLLHNGQEREQIIGTAVAPTVGLMLSLTPDFMKSIGVSLGE